MWMPMGGILRMGPEKGWTFGNGISGGSYYTHVLLLVFHVQIPPQPSLETAFGLDHPVPV